ncbi:hypothetical protein EV702DRAFT_774041 [Suillus placidus]|uniref:Uncharacterized protein n=1 Tax=Suillus placidus TaxID=48579 RepID=A0A9P7A0W0_9AGAM|nr:hypothetical protein EV702DRAFT_774041 [Suillus placidus]
MEMCYRGEGIQTSTSPLGLVLLFAKPLMHWMFGISFAYNGYAMNSKLQQVGLILFPIQVRIYSPRTATTSSSHTGASLRPMYSAGHICLCLHPRRTAPTARLPASHIRAPPDARQPRGRVVACDGGGATRWTEFRIAMLVGYSCGREDDALKVSNREEQSSADRCEDGLRLCWFRCRVCGPTLCICLIYIGAKYIPASHALCRMRHL